MSLKALAEAVIERNKPRNHDATDTEYTVQLGEVKTPIKVALVAKADLAIKAACQGLDITPEQFATICNKEDIELIAKGNFTPECLRAYAISFTEGIQSRRIIFHPTTNDLISHN